MALPRIGLAITPVAALVTDRYGVGVCVLVGALYVLIISVPAYTWNLSRKSVADPYPPSPLASSQIHSPDLADRSVCHYQSGFLSTPELPQRFPQARVLGFWG